VHSSIHNTKKKEGRQLDCASCPSAATIFNFIYGVVMNRSGGGLG